MKAFNNRITGWTAIAAGMCALGVTFSLVGVAVVGWLGDILGTIAAVLIIPMLIAIGKIVMTKHETLGRSVQILGVLGALVDFIQGVLFLSGIIVYEQSVVWNGVARVLIGIAVLTFALLNRKNPAMKTAYVWLSIILGMVMASSFIGLIFQDEINAIMQGTMTETNPVLLAYIFTLAPIFLLGWPIWLIWTGRLFLKRKLSIPEENELVPQTV